MALFQLRKGRDEPAVPATPPQTVEAMRRRAVHRLIGAAILVLAGVIGFPLFFDNQPRPIPVDLPIVIPDKARVAPLVAPPANPPLAGAPAVAVATTPPVKPASAAAAEVVSPPAASPTAEAVVAADKPTPVTPPPGAGARVVEADKALEQARRGAVGEADKALALLEGKDPAAKPAAAEGRFIVQVGAFADADKVREVRRKVEALGVKTYTQVVDTKDGSRIRVRVGPFADKAEATRIAEKIRKLDLSASILSL